MTLVENPVEFSSEGAVLRGVLVAPSGSTGKHLAVVMAHGTSATVNMVAIEYARAFARAGIAAVVYDHRNFGRSDGEPRLEINPWIQCRGYVDALSFASRQPLIDPERIALWGDSYTGGEVVVVAACDERVRAVVAQCPVFGAGAPAFSPSGDALRVIRETLSGGDVNGTPETTTGPIPVVSPDQLGTPSLLAPIQAFRWFIDYGGRPGSDWVNRATRVIPPTPISYVACPYICAAFLRVPSLFMVAPEDEMVHANPKVSRAAYEQVPADKQWHDIADGHFGLLYHPGERFDEASQVQVAFLRSKLGV